MHFLGSRLIDKFLNPIVPEVINGLSYMEHDIKKSAAYVCLILPFQIHSAQRGSTFSHLVCFPPPQDRFSFSLRDSLTAKNPPSSPLSFSFWAPLRSCYKGLWNMYEGLWATRLAPFTGQPSAWTATLDNPPQCLWNKGPTADPRENDEEGGNVWGTQNGTWWRGGGLWAVKTHCWSWGSSCTYTSCL